MTPDAVNMIVKRRVRLVSDAIEVLGPQADVHEVGDEVLMRRVIAKALPAAKARADKAKGEALAATYDSALEAFRTRAAEDGKRWDAFGDGAPIDADAPKVDRVSAARQKRKDRLAGKKPEDRKAS